jgi:hypothetical protein
VTAATAAAATAAAANVAPTALVQPPPASTPPPGAIPGSAVPVRPVPSGKSSWVFALIPLLVLVAASVGFFALRAGSRPPASPGVAPAITQAPTATSAPALLPTSTLAALEPTIAAPVETEAVPTSTPLVVEKTVAVVFTSTALPTATPVVSATALPRSTVTPRPTATAAKPAKTAATASPRPQPTRASGSPAPALLDPPEGASASGMTRFSWSWSGPALEPTQGFEVRMWREGQPEHYGAAAPVANTAADIDVSGTYAVQQGGSGNYFWTVALVQRDPYKRLGPEAPPRVIQVSGGGGGSDGTQPW